MPNMDMQNPDTFDGMPKDSAVKDKVKAVASAAKEAGAAVAEDLKARAAGTYDAAKDAGVAIAADLKSRAADTYEAAKEAGAGITQDLKARAAGTYEAAKEAVADRAGSMADSVSDAGVRLADKLRDAAGSTEADGFPARALNLMANGLSDAAKGMNAQSLSTILSDTRAFAKRNPAIFVLGAAVAGFALMRMIKVSDSEPTAESGVRSALRNQPGMSS